MQTTPARAPLSPYREILPLPRIQATRLARAALFPVDVLIGRGDAVTRRDPPVMEHGLIGILGRGAALGVGVLGTSVCAGTYVLTHPFSLNRHRLLQACEMGAVTLGGAGYAGVDALVGTLLGAARRPMAVLHAAVDRREAATKP
ncbi:MAG TPA: hypothetical protein VFH51_04370 [Myxococcota bacterium]|nr:hypothetical protein [Myxococcota bacterium]